jgi:hypothetical protein
MQQFEFATLMNEIDDGKEGMNEKTIKTKEYVEWSGMDHTTHSDMDR